MQDTPAPLPGKQRAPAGEVIWIDAFGCAFALLRSNSSFSPRACSRCLRRTASKLAGYTQGRKILGSRHGLRFSELHQSFNATFATKAGLFHSAERRFG